MATADIAAKPNPRGETVAFAAALVTVVLWASAFIGIRSAGHHFSPGPLTLGRLLAATLALGALMLIRREGLPGRQYLPKIALCGVLWFAIYNVALNEAERRVDAGTAAMLVNLGPILVAILAGTLLGEGFPPKLMTGFAVAFAGILVIGFATSKQGVSASLGAGLCVLAAVGYAFGVTLQKPLLAHVSALQITFTACLVGTVCCLPFTPGLISESRSAATSPLLWTIYLGVAPTAIGFTTWAYALARTSAGRLGATTYLVPPIVIAMGWLALSETPPALALPGGLLCLIGVALARRT